MSDSENVSGTTVLSKQMYEFPHWNDTATCTECGDEMDVPEMGDPNADMEEPHWRREEHHSPCDDVFHALCDKCYATEVSAIINGETA